MVLERGGPNRVRAQKCNFLIISAKSPPYKPRLLTRLSNRLEQIEIDLPPVAIWIHFSHGIEKVILRVRPLL